MSRRTRILWRSTAAVAAVLALIVGAVVLFFNWNWLKPPIEAKLSSVTGKQVTITGPLSGTWSFRPTITAQDVRIVDPSYRQAPNVAEVRQVSIVIDLWKLLGGTIDLPEIDIDHPVLDLMRNAKGKANWDIAKQAQGPGNRHNMPIIGVLKITQGKVTYRDFGKGETVDANIATVIANGGSGHEEVTLEGHGTYRKAPFTIRLKSGPFDKLRDTSQPYHMDISAGVGLTKLTIDGTVTDPFKAAGLNVMLTAQGDNADDLYHVFGIPAPSTPPYHLSGRLDRQGENWLFKDFSGTVGKSDLHGTLRFDLGRPRLYVAGDLVSKNLDFADLGLLVGAPGSVAPGRPVSQTQKRLAAEYARSDRVLPNAPLEISEVRQVDGDIRFRGEHVLARSLPLEDTDLHLKLENGVMSLAPLKVGVAGGRIDATIVINARYDPVRTDYDIRLRQFQIAPFFEKAGFPQAGEGVLDGRIRLSGIGDSVRQSLGASDGEAGIVVDHGMISDLASQLLGLDVARALGLLISGDKKQIPLNCFVADFEVRNGVMRPKIFLLDTKATEATGRGNIDLADERLDFSIDGKPKKATPLHLGGPINIDGTFKHPDIGLGAATVERGVAAVALGALLTPLAAILGFIEPGQDGNADCSTLIEETKARTAVRPPTTAPASRARDHKGHGRTTRRLRME